MSRVSSRWCVNHRGVDVFPGLVVGFDEAANAQFFKARSVRPADHVALLLSGLDSPTHGAHPAHLKVGRYAKDGTKLRFGGLKADAKFRHLANGHKHGHEKQHEPNLSCEYGRSRNENY